jgi:two-component system OmpR family sensor kinase
VRSLYAKLSLAMIAIIVIVGGGFIVILRAMTTSYYEELTQRLNAPIAMYVTGQQSLMRADGSVDMDELQVLAERAMVINPAVEVYLLDPAGRVVAHALPPGSVKLDRVAVEPVRALVAGAVEMPWRGDDPRNPDLEKVFSAAEVRSNGDLLGYLYVILGGAKYDELMGSLKGGYSRRLGMWGVGTLLALGVTSGLLAFALLTRRLRRLTGDVRRLTDSDFSAGIDPLAARPGGDEIDQLHRAFVGMSERIHDLVDRLQETDRLRRELISNVSHDLRTPLASIQGYLETLLLSNGSLSREEREHCLRVASNNTARLGALVDDLFELSKLDARNVTPSFETFSLAELLQDTVQEFELEAAGKNIRVDTEKPRDATLVYADIGLIQRVLENLLRNAIHFTPPGGRIRIGIDRQPESVSVSISDTGCGIAAADLDSIFDRFYRRETEDTDSNGSAGLGLAIVKRILDLHGSRITVTSETERGTRFEFDLRRMPEAA